MVHAVHMGEMGNVYRILVTKPEGRDHLGDLGLDWRVVLE